MRLINVALFVSVFLLASHLRGPVHAYLDPGTGSMVLQMVLGGIVGALTLTKIYWHRVKAFLLRRKNGNQGTFTD